MRIVRRAIPGVVHHVIAQFIDRDFLVNDDVARETFLRLLGRAMSDSDWRCLAFAVMSNHLHYAMLAGDTRTEDWLRRVHSPFANWTNKRLERIGPMFAGDPSMWTVRPEHVRRLIAYIHNNPVRAGVVHHARESAWTSHRAYLGLTRYAWLDTQFGLDLVGLTAAELDVFVDQSVGYEPEHGALDGIHRAARKRGALELATPPDGRPVEAPLVARRFAHIRPDVERVLQVVAQVTGLSVARLKSQTRDAVTVQARAIAIQCARAVGLPIASMSAALGLTPQRGSQLRFRPLSETDAAAVAVASTRIQDEMSALLSNLKAT